MMNQARTSNRFQNPLSDNELMAFAPSIFADQPWERMSEKYRFIPTISVVNAMRDSGFMPVRALQSRTRIEGKAPFTKHMIRFRHRDFMSLQNVGEELPEIVMVNSHDGASAYQLLAGIFRLACSNGMVVQTADMGSLSVRHSGKDDTTQKVIDGSFSIIEDAPKLTARIADYKQIMLAPSEQETFAKAAIEIKGEDAAKTFNSSRLLQSRRFADGHQDQPRNLWLTMNSVQENMMQGGIRGRSATQRRVTSRAVKSVTEDIRINKALWTLTEGMAKLKSTPVLSEVMSA